MFHYPSHFSPQRLESHDNRLRLLSESFVHLRFRRCQQIQCGALEGRSARDVVNRVQLRRMKDDDGGGGVILE